MITRDQLWAEALYRYKKGETGRMPDDLLHAANEAAEEVAFTEEIAEDRIRDALSANQYIKKDGVKYFRSSEVIEQIGIQEAKRHPESRRPPLPSEREMGKALRNIGADKRKMRIDGKVKNWWFIEEDKI